MAMFLVAAVRLPVKGNGALLLLLPPLLPQLLLVQSPLLQPPLLL
jgi:hypothetical protein